MVSEHEYTLIKPGTGTTTMETIYLIQPIIIGIHYMSLFFHELYLNVWGHEILRENIQTSWYLNDIQIRNEKVHEYVKPFKGKHLINKSFLGPLY